MKHQLKTIQDYSVRNKNNHNLKNGNKTSKIILQRYGNNEMSPNNGKYNIVCQIPKETEKFVDCQRSRQCKLDMKVRGFPFLIGFQLLDHTKLCLSATLALFLGVTLAGA